VARLYSSRRVDITSWTQPRPPRYFLLVMGVEALADYMIDEVRDVYRLPGL